MRITAELSLYPLRDDFLPIIEGFIEDLQDAPGLEVVVNQMSTQLTGELHAVSRVLEQALTTSFESGAAQVLVAKFLNADLPITERPDIGDTG